MIMPSVTPKISAIQDPPLDVSAKEARWVKIESGLGSLMSGLTYVHRTGSIKVEGCGLDANTGSSQIHAKMFDPICCSIAREAWRGGAPLA